MSGSQVGTQVSGTSRDRNVAVWLPAFSQGLRSLRALGLGMSSDQAHEMSRCPFPCCWVPSAKGTVSSRVASPCGDPRAARTGMHYYTSCLCMLAEASGGSMWTLAWCKCMQIATVFSSHAQSPAAVNELSIQKVRRADNTY